MTDDSDFRTFLNRTKALLFIDMDDLVDAGVFEKSDQMAWRQFRDSPWRWMLKASDKHVAAVWAIIRKWEAR
jgi:hypothetical protein